MKNSYYYIATMMEYLKKKQSKKPSMDSDDIDFTETKQKKVKKGRRAGRTETPPSLESASATLIDDVDQQVEPPTETRDPDAPPKPSRRTGGWGRRSEKEEVDSRLKVGEPPEDERNGSDDDIPVIPDLEDQEEEDVASSVALAPNVAVNRVATYRELDNDLMMHNQFLTLDNDIDLKLLGKCLSAEADVQDEDKPWDWDRTFTEVTSEILTEMEKKEGKEEDVGLQVGV